MRRNIPSLFSVRDQERRAIPLDRDGHFEVSKNIYTTARQKLSRFVIGVFLGIICIIVGILFRQFSIQLVRAAGSAPTASTPTSISVATDGTGYVTFTTQLQDGDDDDLTGKIEYSSDGNTWSAASVVTTTISTNLTATSSFNNDTAYQVSLYRGVGPIQAANTSTIAMLYTMDDASGSILDSSGNIRHATNSGATYGASGKFGTSLDFSLDYVLTPSLTLGNNFTVMAWVNSDVADQGSYNRIMENLYSSHFYLGTESVGTGYKLIVKNASSPFGTVQGGTISSTAWQHVAGSYDGTNGRLYVDGSLIATGAFTAPGNVTDDIVIGRASAVASNYWDGQIDEVAVFTGTLSADEIQSIANGTYVTSTLTVTINTKASGSTVSTTDGTIYVRVTPRDSSQDGTAMASAFFSIDNQAPTGLGSFASSSPTATSLKLSWSAVSDTNFDRYDIWYGTNSSDVANRTGSATRWTTSSDSNLATIGTTSSTVTGLSANNTYYFQIWAIDDYGNEATVGSGNQVSYINPGLVPSVTTPTFVSQVTDGTGYITVTTKVLDTDTADLRAKLEYSDNGGSTWYDAQLYSSSLNFGTSTLDNNGAYQLTLDRFGSDSTEDLVSNLSAQYHLHESSGSLLDSSSNGLTGTASNATYGMSGKFGNALYFNGSSSYVSVDDNNALDMGTGNFTVAAWVQTTSTVADYRRILSKYASPTGIHLAYYPSIHGWYFGWSGTSYLTFSGSSYAINDGNWHYIVGKRTGTASAELWIDGVLAGSSTSLTTASANNTAALLIGKLTAGADSTYWTGLIDEVSIYSRALSEAEATALMDNPYRISSTTLTLVWDSKSASNGNGALTGEQSDIQIRVTPNDASQDGSVGTSASFTVDNQAPTGLANLAITATTTNGSVSLSWTSSTESNFDRYDIWYGSNSNDVNGRTGSATRWTTSSDSNLVNLGASTTTITGLTSGLKYFQIWAIDDYGNEQTVGQGSQVSTTLARTYTSAATGNWNIGTTWGGACSSSCTEGLDYPGSTDTVIVTSTYTVTVPSSVSSSFSNLTISGTATFVLQGNIDTGTNITVASGGTLEQKNTTTQTISGTLTVASGGTLTHTDNTTAHSYEVDFSAATLTIAGTVSANQKGFQGGQTDGAGGAGTGGGDGDAVTGGGGAAYGGYGGAAGSGGVETTDVYGSALIPADLGSGGGSAANDNADGGDGGGLIRLTATTMTVSGSITADAEDGTKAIEHSGGGGSGGSIYLAISGTANFSGATLTADGGDGPNGTSSDGGGGGGGRIAIVNYTSYTAPTTLTAYPGDGLGGGKSGSSGSLYLKPSGENGTLTYDANSITETLMAIPAAVSWTVAEFVLKNSASLTIPADATITSGQTSFTNNVGSNTLTVNGNFSPANGFTFSSSTTVTFGSASTLGTVASTTFAGTVTLTSGMTESIVTSTIASGGTLTMSSYITSSPWTLTDLTVNGTLNHSDNTSAQTHVVSISATNITIGSGGAISLSGLGYQGGQTSGTSGSGTGAGTGSATSGGGGGHGSAGGTSSASTAGGAAYGITSTPYTIGSGGGSGGNSTADGGDGGGLAVISTTNFTHNGSITADGSAGIASGAYGGGGGAGGGVYIDISGTFTGNGSMSAAGGNGGDGSSNDGGGGAGGRIAIGTLEGSLSFTGTFSRAGGLGPGTANDGGNGSLYIKPNATFSLNSSYTNLNWPGSISGTASDHDDTISQVDISIQRSSDSKYWNGSIWTDGEQWVATNGTSTWVYTILSNNFTDSTTNTVRARATDSDGEVESSYTSDAFAYTTQANSIPTVSVPTAYQITTSAGIVLASTTIADGDLHDTTTTIEYSLDNGSTWASSTLGTVTISGQDSGFTTSTGKISGIDTSAGDKLITFQWLAGVDAADQDISIAKLRVRANDTFDDSAYSTSTAFALDTRDPASLANVAVATATSHSARLSWTAASDTNFDHYEIWYGTNQSDVQNRTGTATEWDNSDDSNLATAGTTSSTITSGISPGTYYFKIWAIDDYLNDVTIADISYTVVNTLPTVTTSTPSQSITGTRLVTMTAVVQDTDGVATALIVEHSTNGTSWASSTLSSVSASTGSVTTSSGRISSIDTDVASNNQVTLTIVWNVATDLSSTSDDTVYIRLTPVDDIGSGSNATTAAFVVDTVDPSSPGNLSAASTASTSVALTFGAASTEDHFAEYKIFYKQAASGVGTGDTAFTSSSDSDLSSRTFNGTSNTTITGLSPNRVYTFNIWAYDQYGATSNATEMATYTPAAIPSSLSATANGENQIDLAWNANNNAATSVYYVAYSSGTFIATTTATSYNVTGLSAGTSYIFKVRAENAGASGTYSDYSSTASDTTDLNPPTAASGLTFSNMASSSFTISWTDNSNTEDNYAVKYGVSSGTYTTTATTTSANVTSSSVSNLSPNTPYYFVITATNVAGTTTSTESSTTTLAAVPTSLSATPTSQVQIDLSWNANSNPSGTVYDVAFSNGTLIATTTATSYSANDTLTANTSYSFKIRARNSAGLYSDYSDTVSTTTIANTPTAPSGLSFSSIASSSLTVNWTDNSAGDDQESYFEVLYGTDGVSFSSSTSATATDATSTSVIGLAANTLYYFKVRATNNGGTGLSDAASTTTLKNTPTAASGLTLSSITSSTLTISWTDNSSGSSAEDSFIVKYGTDGETYGTTATTTNAGVTSAGITGLSANTLYYFVVRATNNGGTSTSSAASTTTLKATPTAPSTLIFSSISTSTLTISWTDNSSGGEAEDSFTVKYGTNGTSYPSTVTTTNANVTSTGVSSLTPNSQYYFIVTAVNDGGTSTSTASSTYTLANTPQSLSATTASASQVNLSWNATSNPNTTVYYIAHNDGTFVATTTATSYSITGLSANTSYTFKVRAEHAGATGTYSDYSSTASDTTYYAAPAAPSSLIFTNLTTSTFTVSWTDNSSGSSQESSFVVKYGTMSGIYGTTASTTASDVTSVDVSNLSPNTLYYFVITANNNGGTATSTETSTTTYRTGPIEPSSIVFSAITNSSFTVSWTDNSSGNGQEDRFVVKYTTDGMTYTTASTTAQDVISAPVTGLSANTLYSVVVLASHNGGISTSTAATTTTLKDAPTAPSGLTATTVTNAAVSISWTDNSSGASEEDSFTILSSTDGNTYTTAGTALANATSATISSLFANTTYYFKIRATNNGGSGTSNALSTTTLHNTPTAPSSVTFGSVSTSSLSISWTDNSSGNEQEQAFVVKYGTDGSSYGTTITTTVSNVTSTPVSGLTPGTRYYVIVIAQNETGSATSTSANTMMLADIPSTPTLTNAATTTIDLSFSRQDNPSGAVDYAIQETTTGQFVNSNGQLSVTAVWQTDVVGQWGTTTTVRGLTPSVSYTFRVKGRNSSGTETSYSSTASLSTRAAVPGAPTLSNITTSSLSLTLSTNGNSSYAAYAIFNDTTDTYIDQNGASTSSAVWQTNTAWGTVSITSLSLNTSYSFIIKARNTDLIETDFGSAGNSYTLAATPGTSTVVALSTSSLSITLDVNGNSTGTEFALNTPTVSKFVHANGTLDNSAIWQTNAVWGTKTITGLSIDTQYSFQVKARNGNSVETGYGESVARYTYANSAGQPTVGSATTSTLALTIATNSNPSNTTYALYNETSGTYVAANGFSSTTPIYQTTSTWGAVTIRGLSGNTGYQFSVIARNGDSVTTATSTSSDLIYTLVNPAGQPSTGSITTSMLDLTLDANSNATNTTYAIFNETTQTYIASNGSVTSSAVYQTTSTWDTPTITGLTPNTSYQFSVIARNAGNVNAATSSQSTAIYTLAEAPLTPTISSITTSTLRLTLAGGTNPSATDYAIYESNIAQYVALDRDLESSVKVWQTIAEWGSPLTVGALSVNTQYCLSVLAKNVSGVLTATTTANCVYSLANATGRPSAGSATTSTLIISIDENGNPANTRYALYNETDDTYVATNGTQSATPVFQSTSTWAVTPVRDLSVNTAYTFSSLAQNGDQVGAATSTASTPVYTLALAPTSLSLTNVSQSSLTLSFNPNSNPTSTTFAFYESRTNRYVGGDGIIDAVVPVSQTTSTWGSAISVTGLSASTQYCFSALAYNGNSMASASTTADCITTSAATTPNNNPSSGGGSGGSGHTSLLSIPSVATLRISASQVRFYGTAPPSLDGTIADAAIIDVELMKNYGFSFRSNSQVHTLVMREFLSNTQGKFTLYSDPIDMVLAEGQEKVIDVDANGEFDIHLVLKSIETQKKKANAIITNLSAVPFVINDGKSFTSSQAVTLRFMQIPGVTSIAVSEDPTFKNIPFIPFAKTRSFTLTPQNGEKKIYAKFRTLEGATAVVADTIILLNGMVQDPLPIGFSCSLSVGQAYKTAGSPTVYYITVPYGQTQAPCTKRAFSRADIFFTYFTSWNGVKFVSGSVLSSIPEDVLGFMPMGPLYDPKYGAIVKTVSDPKVYLLLGLEKYWITNEDVFVGLKYRWDWIEDVDEDLLKKYSNGSEIIYTTHHPNYTIIKYKNDPKVYRLEPGSETSTPGKPQLYGLQVKRHISDQHTFESLNFRWDRIVTVADFEQYETGEPLTAATSTKSVFEIKPTELSQSFVFTQTLRRTDTHPQVSELQTVLKKFGYFKLPVITNYFGIVTEQALKAFQKDQGIAPLGIVGHQTRAALNRL